MLRTGDRERCTGKIDLGPLQVANLGSPQAVAEGNQDHGLVAMRLPVALASFDQLLDLFLGEVFPRPDIGILGPTRRDFPFYGGWCHDFQGWFCHMDSVFLLR